MKKKLFFSATMISLLAMLSLPVKSNTSSYKKLTQEEWASGFQTAYNLIIRGRVNPTVNSTYQLTLATPYAAQTPDWYDGLVSGATAAWAKLQGPVKSPPKTNPGGTVPTTIITYYSYIDVTYNFVLSDGSLFQVQYSGVSANIP